MDLEIKFHFGYSVFCTEKIKERIAAFGETMEYAQLWVIVRGSIDGYEKIRKYRLMPSGGEMESGKGHLFLAVKSEIRKKINKQAGDYVHIILYPDKE